MVLDFIFSRIIFFIWAALFTAFYPVNAETDIESDKLSKESCEFIKNQVNYWKVRAQERSEYQHKAEMIYTDFFYKYQSHCINREFGIFDEDNETDENAE